MRYKRNQVEEAIAACMETALESRLRARVKRLLQSDRALERDPASHDPEAASYAFFDADPPGSGVEVEFSAFAAFALLMGIRIMGHQWPQATAVRIVRRVRPQLEAAHARILKQDRGALFEQKTLLRQAREGMIAT